MRDVLLAIAGVLFGLLIAAIPLIPMIWGE